ncbi:hypothetical protein [cf. Phormidesmis sp. LEGE 11477]|uniref:hypothetical protein n=1 Tax=cf. Phormidesmis sp. LEGE 11477 TaxID=1828680 RepID=UPI001880A8E3|nr:hypothetical protein [cf. Phormidesmis sp. LEGE 11477]MBE9064254.1 hypothetical protein [cf. Phormidesmis sp. LEGE 11477]
MTQPTVAKSLNATATCIDDGYAKVTEVATALNRHERTIRGYIRLLREEFGHPDFLEKLNGRLLNSRQQAVLTELAHYKAKRTSPNQIREFLMADCSARLSLNEACDWLASRISQTLLTQFKEHFSS